MNRGGAERRAMVWSGMVLHPNETRFAFVVPVGIFTTTDVYLLTSV